MIKENCKHEKFQANSRVGRLSEVEGGPITRYVIEIQVHCVECMMPFQFVGLPGGVSPNYPTTCVEKIEARMPIKPI